MKNTGDIRIVKTLSEDEERGFSERAIKIIKMYFPNATIEDNMEICFSETEGEVKYNLWSMLKALSNEGYIMAGQISYYHNNSSGGAYVIDRSEITHYNDDDITIMEATNERLLAELNRRGLIVGGLT